MKTPSADFEAIADDLYRLRPDEFTKARNAKVSEARASGDRALAEAVKELRRPTVSAWLANYLVHDRREEFVGLLTLGESIRDASDRLDGEELRRLSRQRHQVLATLTAEAAKVARASGIGFSSAVSSELEATLAAALSDEGAAAALQAGRLTTALRYSGFGTTGSTSTTALTRKNGRSPSMAEPQGRGEPERQTKPTDAKRIGLDRVAQRALKTAESGLEAARSELRTRQHLTEEARARRDELRRSVQELEAQLEDLRAEEAGATREAAAAVEDCGLAEQAVKTAEQRASEARRRMES
jgi:hypothetical protein